MKKTIKIISLIILFILLTALTQVGGLILILSLLIAHFWKTKIKGKTAIIFIVLYTISTFLIIPLTAPIWGREKIINSEKIKPATFASILLNRNYVRPSVNTLLRSTARKLTKTDVTIIYLDANFPFLKGFPLPPHLSHNDGKKIDFSLVYKNKNGKITDKTKSLSGYGVFENPKGKEISMTEDCKKRGHFQYDYPKYFAFGRINSNLDFSESGTKEFMEALLENNSVDKIFIEPHLKQRLGINDSRIRYHGCHSVRHDDHIHVQIK